MRAFVIKALRNYGYRFLEKQSGCYIFGKPIGYGIFRVGVSDPGSEPSDHWLIYYDNDTRRSTRFERNLLRDGFKVLPWEE